MIAQTLTCPNEALLIATAPCAEKPSCLQTTSASAWSQPLSQMVPHSPCTRSSTRPSYSVAPPTRRVVAARQFLNNPFINQSHTHPNRHAHTHKNTTLHIVYFTFRLPLTQPTVFEPSLFSKYLKTYEKDILAVEKSFSLSNEIFSEFSISPLQVVTAYVLNQYTHMTRSRAY